MKNNALRWIKKSVGKLNISWTLLIVTAVLQSALVVWFALSVKELVNSAFSANATIIAVLKNTLITALLAVSAFLFGVWNKILSEKCRINAEVNLKNNAFKNLLEKDYKLISEYRSGDVVSRLSTDTQIVARGYATVLPTLVSMVAKVLLSVGALLVLQPLFTIILLSFGIVTVVCSFLLRKYFKKLYKNTRSAESDVVSFYNENANNLLAVKVFSAEDKTATQSEKIVSNYEKCAKKQRYSSASLTSAMSFAFTAFYIATLVWGLVGIVNHVSGVDFGLITAMVQLVSQLQSPFANATALISVYYEMITSAERIMELEQVVSEKRHDKVDAKTVYEDFVCIKAENLTFSYGRDKVFNNVNFQINKGDFTLIKGESGIGKSTLLKLLLGVYGDFQGDLCVKTNEREIPLDGGARPLFAYVPQGNLLFSGTIKENLCFLNENATENEIENAIKIACMEFVFDLPEGINTLLGERGAKLSEGQCQRVAIARAILGDRNVLLLDEATSALDDKTQKRLLQNLNELKKQGKTIIMISHKICEGIECDKTLVIADGKVSEIGKMEK